MSDPTCCEKHGTLGINTNWESVRLDFLWKQPANVQCLQLLFSIVSSWRPIPTFWTKYMGTEKWQSLWIFCYIHFWLGGLVAQALRANCSLSCATGPSPFAPDTDSGKADSMWKWHSFLNMVYWQVRSCRQNKKGWQPELCRLTCWLTKVYFTHCDDLLLVMPVSYCYCFHVLFMCELTP